MTDRPLSRDDRAALDADLALLAQADPAPGLSEALLARILTDAAEAAPAPAATRSPQPTPRRAASAWATVSALWGPVSAGVAAAGFGVWLGWTDPAGVSSLAIPFDAGGLTVGGAAGGAGAPDGGAVRLVDAASLLDMEL